MEGIKSKFKDTFRRFRRSDDGNESNDDGNQRRRSNSTSASENNDDTGPDDFPDSSAQPTPQPQFGLSEIFPNLEDLFLNPKGTVTNVQGSSNVSVGPRIYFNGPIYDQRHVLMVRSSMDVSSSNTRTDDSNRSKYPRERPSGSQSSQSEVFERTQSQKLSGSEASSSHQQNVIPVKTQDIENLMASRIEPSHEYFYHISRSQGKNWKETFYALGYSLGEIDTFVIDAQCKGDSIREARYRLLLDWMRNNKDSNLGHLTTKLWEAKEWDIVKELAVIYKNREYDSEDEDEPVAETSFNTR